MVVLVYETHCFGIFESKFMSIRTLYRFKNDKGIKCTWYINTKFELVIVRKFSALALIFLMALSDNSNDGENFLNILSIKYTKI